MGWGQDLNDFDGLNGNMVIWDCCVTLKYKNIHLIDIKKGLW
jgi:hypothetical protein